MKPRTGYIPRESKFPLKGLNTSVPSTQLDPSYSPRLSNMFIREGEIFKRSGYSELVDEALDGTVMGLVDFQLVDGTLKFVAFTSTRQYVLSTNADDWEDITATAQLHLIQSADSTANTFTITGDHRTVFAVDAEFTVADSTGNDGDYKVTAVSVASDITTITVTSVADDTADGTIEGAWFTVYAADATSNYFRVEGSQASLFSDGADFVVAGSTGNDGEYTVVSTAYTAGPPDYTQINVASVADSTDDGTIEVLQELTTIEGDTFDWEVGTDDDNHRLYVTNGRDRIRYWDGSAARFLIWHPEHTDFVTCKTLSVFYGLLVLGNVTYTANEPKLLAWSDTNDFEEWTTGLSGTLLIPGLSGSIQRLMPLGDRLIIYSEDSIGSLMYVGTPVVIAAEVLIPTGVRLVSPRAMESFGSAHVFASQENIYFFDGTRSIRGVGDTVRVLYKQDLEVTNCHRLFMFNHVAKRMIFMAVPVVVDTTTPANDETRVYCLDYDIFDLRAFKWTRVEYTDVPRAIGFFDRRSAPSWLDEPLINWDEDEDIWHSEDEREGFPVRAMGSGSRVYVMNESVGIDDDADVASSYETMDFVVPDENLSVHGRWAEIEAELGGTEVDVHYSTDHGETWVVAETGRALISRYSQYSFPIDVVARTLRVRFSHSSAYYGVRWIRVWVKPGAAR